MGLIDKGRARHQNKCHHRIKHTTISLQQLNTHRFKDLHFDAVMTNVIFVCYSFILFIQSSN